jgi:hypothetical protein
MLGECLLGFSPIPWLILCSMSKKKRKTTAKKATVLPQYQGPDLRAVEVVSDLFEDMKFSESCLPPGVRLAVTLVVSGVVRPKITNRQSRPSGTDKIVRQDHF